MLLLGNERPNFPTNRMKHINKGMMQIISLIFQTEGGWLSREGGLLQKLAFRRGGGLIGEGELNRASTVLASGRRVDLSQGHSDYKSSVLITRPVALLWTSLEISPFFSLVVWLTLLILSDSLEGHILLVAGRQGQQTIRLIFCRKRWFSVHNRVDSGIQLYHCGSSYICHPTSGVLGGVKGQEVGHTVCQPTHCKIALTVITIKV